MKHSSAFSQVCPSLFMLFSFHWKTGERNTLTKNQWVWYLDAGLFIMRGNASPRGFPQHAGLQQCQTAFICTYSGINPWMHTARLKLSVLIIMKPPRRACRAQSRKTLLISFRHFILETHLSVADFSKSRIQFLTHWKWKVHLRYIQGKNKH